MENYFFAQLNNNLIQALNQNVASILSQEETFLPPLINPLAGMPITDANFFNLMLSNNLNGTNFTEFVKMGEAVSKGIDFLSNLSQGSQPKGIISQEDGMSANPRYSFMVPVQAFDQSALKDSLRANWKSSPQNNYVPFQSNNASMSDFGNFVQEQFANAINASLTGCPFKINVPANAMDQFKGKLIDAISKDPSFVAMTANKAQQEVNELQRALFNRDNFIEKARDVNSPEFRQLTSALTDHINDMCQHGKKSFNPEFNELSRPLVINIQVNLGNAGQAKEQEQKKEQSASAAKAAPKQSQEKKSAQKTDQSASAAKAAPRQSQAKKPAQKTDQSASATKAAPKETQSKTPTQKTDQNASAAKAAPKQSQSKTPAQKTDQGASAAKTAPKQTQAKKPAQEKAQSASAAKAAPRQSQSRKPAQKNDDGASAAQTAPNQKADIEKAVANFVKENLKQDGPATTLANTFVGTLAEKAKQLVQSDERVPAGLALACSVINPVLTGSFKARDFVKIADNIVTLQELKGDKSLRNSRDSGDANSFKSGLEKVIRDAPIMLEKAMSQLTGSTQQKTQTQSLSTGARR